MEAIETDVLATMNIACPYTLTTPWTHNITL
jgi:hypothetical protein